MNEQTNANGAVGADDLERAMSRAIERLHQLRKSILEAVIGKKHSWFQNILVGILNCALLDHKAVQTGIQESVPLAAWGLRNLLELRVMTEYVLVSEKNANDFRNDLIIDAKELYEAFTKSHQASHAALVATLSEMAEQSEGQMKEVLAQALRRECECGPQTTATDSEAGLYRKLMLEYGLGANAKPKRASEIARQIRQNEDFDPKFKICSKLMHRTVLSIASSTIPGSLDEASRFLSLSADGELLSIYRAISKYVEERGVQPPEN